MNIFYIDVDPTKAAQYHYDRHVVKMILESAQLLCTSHHILDGFKMGLYKPTHKNHPCSIWVRESSYNYDWLYQLFCSLCDEYTFRFGKIHKTSLLIPTLKHKPRNIPLTEFTQPRQAMPDEYKDISSLVAYRKYYRDGKSHLKKYTKRSIPFWLE